MIGSEDKAQLIPRLFQCTAHIQSVAQRPFELKIIFVFDAIAIIPLRIGYQKCILDLRTAYHVSKKLLHIFFVRV